MNYTIRIQLTGDPGQDVYNDLHLRMKKGGFLQTVTGVDSDGNGIVANLPHATYYGSSDATVDVIRDWARGHAKEAWGKSIIFVSETNIWAWGKS